MTTDRTTVAANLRPMFISPTRKVFRTPHNCSGGIGHALVESDIQKMRVGFALAPETIRERMQELEHSKGPLRCEARIEEASHVLLV
jgi:hypothetical protein